MANVVELLSTYIALSVLSKPARTCYLSFPAGSSPSLISLYDSYYFLDIDPFLPLAGVRSDGLVATTLVAPSHTRPRHALTHQQGERGDNIKG